LRLVERAIRCPDPFVHVEDDWLLRRIGPHCSRVELSALPKRRDEARLLHAMGRETANIHHGTPDAVAAIRKDLGRRKKDWLFIAAQGMADATTRDWKQWKSSTS